MKDKIRDLEVKFHNAQSLQQDATRVINKYNAEKSTFNIKQAELGGLYNELRAFDQNLPANMANATDRDWQRSIEIVKGREM